MAPTKAPTKAERKQELLDESSPQSLTDEERELFTPKELEAWADRLRKEFLREHKRPGQLSAQDRALFSDKEITEWQKSLVKATNRAIKDRQAMVSKQNQHAHLQRLRRLVNRNPAVRQLFNDFQAARAEVEDLKKQLAAAAKK